MPPAESHSTGRTQQELKGRTRENMGVHRHVRSPHMSASENVVNQNLFFRFGMECRSTQENPRCGSKGGWGMGRGGETPGAWAVGLLSGHCVWTGAGT